jgi:hypothetical protein
MRWPTTACILLLASCGAHISSNPADEHGSLDGGAGRWPAPAAVTVAATQAIEDDVTLTSNALELVYAIADPTTGRKDLYYTARTAIGAPWAPVVPLPFDRTASSEEAPRFSVDDRTLYFASDRAADDGNLDIYAVSHAPAATTPWGMPEPVAPLTTAQTEKWLAPCSGGPYVVVQSTAAGDTDLFEGTLGGGAPAPIRQQRRRHQGHLPQHAVTPAAPCTRHAAWPSTRGPSTVAVAVAVQPRASRSSSSSSALGR